jgi:hypothetical protein
VNNKNNILNTLVWVELAQRDDFLKVKETLTRIGVASRKDKKLFQSCHILHKQGRYAIVHFKELFALDGKPTDFSDEDKGRRNAICNLLSQWGLVKLIDPQASMEPVAPISQIKVITHKEKDDWELVTKYSIGKKLKY